MIDDDVALDRFHSGERSPSLEQSDSSGTICSVLEAGWKPRSPGFWQAPDARASLQKHEDTIMEDSGWALTRSARAWRKV